MDEIEAFGPLRASASVVVKVRRAPLRKERRELGRRMRMLVWSTDTLLTNFKDRFSILSLLEYSLVNEINYMRACLQAATTEQGCS